MSSIHVQTIFICGYFRSERIVYPSLMACFFFSLIALVTDVCKGGGVGKKKAAAGFLLFLFFHPVSGKWFILKIKSAGTQKCARILCCTRMCGGRRHDAMKLNIPTELERHVKKVLGQYGHRISSLRRKRFIESCTELFTPLDEKGPPHNRIADVESRYT